MEGNTRESEQGRAPGQPRFGIDAPGLVLGFAIGGPLLLLASLFDGFAPALSLTMRYTGFVLCAEAILMTLSSLYGKRQVARQVIDALRLHGDEQVLDVGCGRGLLLLEAARRLPRGRATAFYAQILRETGFTVQRSWPGFRMFPWVRIVRGRKP
ncbi:hypothetical protein [Rhodanobacter geophilus]|uniref:Uncharacterized protein n=1 Tax=Rhodanobacter geophilus TaxID=3162488 RepID=A0ABV3QPB3_9GAMM